MEAAPHRSKGSCPCGSGSNTGGGSSLPGARAQARAVNSERRILRHRIRKHDLARGAHERLEQSCRSVVRLAHSPIAIQQGEASIGRVEI